MVRSPRVNRSRTPDPSPGRQAVLYVRVSSMEQKQLGFSPEAQLKLLRDYVTQKGFVVPQAHIFEDVETAKQTGRKQFGRMVDLLRDSSSCRTILVEKTDRLYRNLKDYVILDELDVEIHFVKEGVVLTKDSRSSEKFIHGIKVLMAKNYVDNLGEEARKGMLEKAEQGMWPSVAPVGYVNVEGPDRKRSIVPDPAKAPLIQNVFEWYATGRHSMKQIVKMAREAGFTLKRGKPVRLANVHWILHNLVYTGSFVWDGRIYKGTYQPLISRELWDRVQGVSDQRDSAKTKRGKHDFAFAGLITCGHCGCALVGELKKRKYVYYHCTGYRGKCPEKYAREELLEEKLSEILGRLTFDDDVMSWISDALRQSHGDEKQFHADALARLRQDYDRLQERIDKMYVDKLDGRIDVAFFERKSTEWRREQQQLRDTMSRHEAANQSYLEEGIRILELARKAQDLFRRQVPREKRRLLEFVLSNCSWKSGELTPNWRKPFDLLASAAMNSQSSVVAGASLEARTKEWRAR